jgi:16S rRNA (cytidine1402-2'-O)-methyltransferase
MSGTLYVVATPIGNLEDITLRALRRAREVAVIAAEDTRRTARLLNHHGISTRTVSFHAHNAKSRVPQLLARLQAGSSVAIVTDAGTPGISDPGLELVQAAISNGIAVDPVPGASAPLTALVASGFAMVPFTLFGFAPNRSNARLRWLQTVCATQHSFSFFETPHRIRETMTEAAQFLGDRPIMLAREITKLHQEFLRGTASELVDHARQPVASTPSSSDQLISRMRTLYWGDQMRRFAREFWRLTEDGRTARREAVRLVARGSGRSSKDVYSVIERVKKSVQ